MTVLFCAEVPELKLGPGSPGDANVIRFREGFAAIADDDPRHDEKLAWVKAPGTPYIEILEDAEAKVRVSATSPGAFVCPKCGKDKAFATKAALNGHLLSHRPKPVQ